MPYESKKNKPGRPRVDKSKELLHNYGIRLTDMQASAYIKYGEGNLSAGVRKAVDIIVIQNYGKSNEVA